MLSCGEEEGGRGGEGEGGGGVSSSRSNVHEEECTQPSFTPALTSSNVPLESSLHLLSPSSTLYSKKIFLASMFLSDACRSLGRKMNDLQRA